MSVITKGRIFSNGEQLTAEKLNVLVDDASFNSSTAVDNSTTRVNSSGAITVKPQGITSTELAASERWQNAYPIGSIYINASNSTNPSTLLGFGTWAAFGAGRVLVGIDSGDTDFDTAEETNGVKEVTLTAAQSGVPAHAHKFRITGDSTPDSGTTGGIVVSPAGSTVNGVAGNPTDAAGQQIGGNTAADASSAHTNLQPYIVVYMWKRTA